MSAEAPAFARVLAAGRGGFNARVAEMRSRVPTFDVDAFAAFLREGVAPVVEAVAARDPHAAMPCAEAAFDYALELVARRLVGPGARSVLPQCVWTQLLPWLATHVAAAPAPLIAELTHAALHLDAVPQARGIQWIDHMKRLGPQCGSRGQLLAIGQVLAWTAGLSHFRGGALQRLATLPPELARKALMAPPERAVGSMCARLRADRWWSPADGVMNSAARGFDVGAFTGFGGAFPEPPQARAAGEDFVVRSGDRHFWLVVDAYGWTLHAAPSSEFDLLPARSENASTRVVCSPLSHRLHVMPRDGRAS